MTNTTTNNTKTARDIVVGDQIVVSDRFAKYVGLPTIAGVRLPVAEITTYPGETVIGLRLEGIDRTVHADQYAQIEVV